MLAYEWLEFEGDPAKDRLNQKKHGVAFKTAEQAFYNPQRIIMQNVRHSEKERRYFCYGLADGGVLTVRFTLRGDKIRIIGAAYWREGKRIYAEKNRL